ncbi:MAG: hypothetical protein M3Y87_31120, partial [Myxococcota bacterium]|nr:hypothetical protein [Myxococcota bacterium]
MRAFERAPGAAGAGVRVRASAAFWCVLMSIVGIVASLPPSAARADDPGSAARTLGRPSTDVGRDGPLVLRLAIENDNLLFGNYARMVGREHDGTDLGRTHTSSLGLRYDLADRVGLRLDLSSQLFTAALGGAEPGRHAMVPVAFHELDRLRLGMGLRQPGAPWRVRLGLAVEISNHEEVTFGATGQQRGWHDFMANTVRSGAWQYDHRPSGLGVT